MLSEQIKTFAKWSVDDYHSMIEAGILSDRKVELLEGDILEMSPEGFFHVDYREGLADYLRNRLRERAWVREAGPITLTDSEPEPDIAVVQLPRSRYRTHHPYPEEIFLLIEISDSTLTKDLTLKKQIYAEANITEYWIVDVKGQQIRVFRYPTGSDYQVQETFSQGVISPLSFPDVGISLERLWQGNII